MSNPNWPTLGMLHFSNGWKIDVHAVADDMVFYEIIDPTGRHGLRKLSLADWHKAIDDAAADGITVLNPPS